MSSEATGTPHAKAMDALARIVEVLSQVPTEERARLVRAAMIVLGEDNVSTPPIDEASESTGGFAPRAQTWMKQNGVSAAQLQEAFHISDGVVDVIAPLPGRNKKEQTYSAYIITGIGQLLATGNASFDDKSARALCERSGCYDSGNHSAYLRDKGNEFAGSKDKGWVLTAPGLKRGADLVKQMQSGV